MTEKEAGSLELRVENVFQEAIGEEHGLSRNELDGLKKRVAICHKEIERRRGEDIGFMELPYERDLAVRIEQKAEELRDWCRNFVVLGIGGSALGNIAVHAALNHPFHNLLPEGHPARRGAPRIFVLDNVDPALLAGFFELIDGELDATAFNVITKSGSTAETMSQFLHVRDRLRRAGLDPSSRIVATTGPDPGESLLRRIAEEDGYATFPIPPNVGGRFSVLSAVGLLSASVGGTPISEMLDGAAAMDSRCRADSVEENPAALYAAILYLFYGAGKPITVLMPYSSALRRLGDWYCQLWAESLGKRDGVEAKDVFVGPTPVAAVGVTDQHSVMQLYQDGGFDKVITLIEVEDLLPGEEHLPICEGESEEELSYLADHGFGGLFGAELAATRCALTDKHRPNLTVRIPAVEASALGELFMLFEYAVSYSGCLYGVNTFNQPGVELGKRYTYGLMGREGYEAPAGAL
ncbi:MAG: glucose-6-phosphate isomerase [Candidatus Brocadiaceae bacterium]|jgi:glucose-6-phosphate isomerase